MLIMVYRYVVVTTNELSHQRSINVSVSVCCDVNGCVPAQMRGVVVALFVLPPHPCLV